MEVNRNFIRVLQTFIPIVHKNDATLYGIDVVKMIASQITVLSKIYDNPLLIRLQSALTSVLVSSSQMTVNLSTTRPAETDIVLSSGFDVDMKISILLSSIFEELSNLTANASEIIYINSSLISNSDMVIDKSNIDKTMKISAIIENVSAMQNKLISEIPVQSNVDFFSDGYSNAIKRIMLNSAIQVTSKIKPYSDKTLYIYDSLPLSKLDNVNISILEKSSIISNTRIRSRVNSTSEIFAELSLGE